MKKIIRLTESDLRGIVKQSVNRILKESLGNISKLDGEYEVYFEDGLKNVIIDTSEPYIAIGDYTMYDEEAMDAINRIYGYLKSSGGDVREAIEQYIYDELR
jgi:hypothetical protein